MMTEAADGTRKRLLRTVLPWLLGLAAFLVYLATLNHWVSLQNWGAAIFYTSSNSLLQTAKVAGWMWQPQIYEPLYWLATWPLHWLPPRALPVALNLFSCICASLTLALLARCVMLLPHDRTDVQREKEHGSFALLSIPTAWMPPLFAVLVCGLQLTFWEHATIASGEMLDLLLFAYVIRSLLEFRLDGREERLFRAALVFGLGITNNWAMIGFFPLFLAALVWIRGLDFFNVRFLLRMFLWGLAGLLLYLLLPLLRSNSDIANVPFWTALKLNLAGQKMILSSLFRGGRGVLVLLSLTSLLPVLIISIRWTSYFGDTSRLGVALAKLTFHVVHALFLIACIWVALDPPFSPRNKGFGLPFLTFYFLGALAVGYCSGYFLLIFAPPPAGARRIGGLERFGSMAITFAIWLLLVLAPLALVYRNLPQIRLTNGPALRDFTALTAKMLPPKGVLYSDDSRRLLLLQAELAPANRLKDYVFVDTSVLSYPDYHRFLRKKYGTRWPLEIPKSRQQPVDEISLMTLLLKLTETNTVYYLHPSFGYYFEVVYQQPQGLVYKLNPYPTNTLIAPLLSEGQVAENEAFWDGAAQKHLGVVTPVPQLRGDTRFPERIFTMAKLQPAKNEQAGAVAGFYSRSINFWGVDLQRNNQLGPAGLRFDLATRLNPDNIVAEINRECNKNLQAGRKSSVRITKSIEDEFGSKYRNWDQVMNDNGPFDEPRFCYEQGRLFVRNGHFRQAAYAFDRVRHLAPETVTARLYLAQLYVMSRIPDEALKVVDEIRTRPEFAANTNQNELLMVEASARLVKNELPAAEKAINQAVEKSPQDHQLLATATQVYMDHGAYTNALDLVERELKLSPDNPGVLVNKGYLCIQLERYCEAIPVLDKALATETNNYSALLNRAIANLRCGKLEDAQRDYERLQKNNPTEFRLYYGLAEIAYRKRDTNAALRNYSLYLTNAPPDTEEAKIVASRIRELKPK